MPFDKGSLILLDYTARIKDNGEIFETTIEEEAKNPIYTIQLEHMNQDLFPWEKAGY
ncbi:MAG: hypothetical protein ACXWFZ_05010 [Nitrososphaeraceae archaeon]